MGKITLCSQNLIFFLIAVLGSSMGFSQTYTNAGTFTYTVPAGVTSVTVEAWGGGGSGGNRSSNGATGGGGGGAYARSTLAVTPGNTYSVRVGAGSSTFSPGGDSYFGNATTVMAKGGNSSANNVTTGASGGSAMASVGTVRYAGGNGGNISGNTGGGGGSSAGTSANGTNASGTNGGNAPTGGGDGANGRGTNGNGYPGLNPGGGGGGTRKQGGSGSRLGGQGADGQIIITENFSEINIVGNSNSITDGDTTPSLADFTDFGVADINTGIITRTYTIQNTGNLALTIGAITVGGANPTNFTITSAPAATIPGGGSTNFSISFNPNAIGVRNATISIANSDIDENPYNFALRGTGTDSEITVRGNSLVIVNGDNTPSTIDFTDFGTVASGLGTQAHLFVIENAASSTTPLSVGPLTITGANASEFTVTAAPAASVPINGSTTFQITFTPIAGGVRTAVISIDNSDGDENPYTFTVVGIGAAPDVNIYGNNTLIVSGDTAPTLTDWTNFGGAHITGGLRTRTFTIENPNTSTQPLSITSVTMGGDFTLISPPAAIVPVGGTTTFTIQFDPSALGNRTTNVRVYNNTSNKNPYLFTINGTGSNPEISVTGNGINIADGDMTPGPLDNTDFGTVSIDNGSTQVTYTIRNTGATVLNVNEIIFSGPDAASFSVITPPANIVWVNNTTQFVVNFAPTTVGVKNAVLTIINDDQNEDPFDFAITGLAVRTYPDTDGDDISDNIDIDDDNDGILDIDEQANCIGSPISQTAGHLYLNETFGAGTTRGKININIPGAMTSYCYEDGIVGTNTTACPDQSDWSVNDGEYTVNYSISGPAGDPTNISTWSTTNWTRQSDHTPGDVAGRMAIFNASYTPQVFYETTISGIMPNVPLTYSFWAMNIMSQSHYPGTILPNITVEFIDLENDVVVSTFNTGNIGRCGTSTGDNSCALSQWREFTTSVNLGNVTSFLIRFINNATGGNGNDLALDDITIRQDYCDYDLDGVSNLFDLDSDNDGIPDIEEGGFKHLSNGRGVMDMDETVWRDENRNGLHDEIDELRSNGGYFIPDSDYDGIPDYLDLDSDNDSLFDVDEAGLLNGDGDINGDGVGEGPDSDDDGFLDVWDTFVGPGTAVRPYAQDTSGYDIPDYRNTDSDFDGVYDITGTLYEEFDIYGIGEIIGTDDFDRDGIFDNFDTHTSFMGSPRDLDRKLFLNLDGRNDYAEGPQLMSNLPGATIMGWIKLTNPYTADGVVLGQDNFLIRIDASGTISATAKNQTISSAVSLTTDRWYHVAATFDGSDASEKLKLFVNGEQVAFSNAGTLAGTLNSSTTPFTIGKNALSLTEFFKGDIDEARIFGIALTNDQLQKMVYQEIRENGGAIRGEIIPRDIEASTWSSLLGCFRMDVYKNDVIDNYASAAIDLGVNPSYFRIFNVKNIRYQLAPMPFVTTLPGSIDQAVSQNNFVEGTDAMTYDWSIVHIQHDIDFNFNQTDLGLIIDPGVQVNLIDDNVLRNTWYLKMDGNVDLKDKAQLVQTSNSQLDPTSSGALERDQQGTTNKFNYNYWGSPVGGLSTTSNNNAFTIAGTLRDGTDPDNIQNIQWTNALNSIAGSPITLSSYWIFKFQNVGNDYANWTSVGPNGTLLPGEGFTLKGSSAPSESQNYTFVGKPNNGLIEIPIAANNLNLSGNPYPSALDANEFLTDNLTSTTGTIYIWEHYTTNNTHVLANYQGGYATRTLVGGTAPVSPADVSGLGSSSRIPGRFLPVGQGFFMTGSATGGQLRFNNNQRAFIKEDHVDSNAMFRSSALAAATPFNNFEDEYETDTFARVRLAYISPNNYHRQLLLGFMDDNASPAIDPGYDAIHIDNQPSDMYFKVGESKLNIQGDGYFNSNNIYPLEIKTHIQGSIKVALDGLENFDENQQVYIHDAQTDEYHNIKNNPFSMTLPAGTYTRFSLRFTESLLNIDTKELSKNISIAYSDKDMTLNIMNLLQDVQVRKVDLYNILGQHIMSFDVKEGDQTHIRIPVNNLTTGTYITTVSTDDSTYSTKILIP